MLKENEKIKPATGIHKINTGDSVNKKTEKGTTAAAPETS